MKVPADQYERSITEIGAALGISGWRVQQLLESALAKIRARPVLFGRFRDAVALKRAAIDARLSHCLWNDIDAGISVEDPYHRAWRGAHPEQMRAARRRYRLKNRRHERVENGGVAERT